MTGPKATDMDSRSSRRCPQGLKVSVRFQIGLMALIWTLVGAMLLLRAVLNLLPLAGSSKWIWLGAASMLGAVKGRYVIARSADRLIARIRSRGDGRCVFKIFPLKTWLLIGAMILMGFLLRNSGFMPELIWGIYAGIGVALISSGLLVWKIYFSLKSGPA